MSAINYKINKISLFLLLLLFAVSAYSKELVGNDDFVQKIFAPTNIGLFGSGEIDCSSLSQKELDDIIEAKKVLANLHENLNISGVSLSSYLGIELNNKFRSAPELILWLLPQDAVPVLFAVTNYKLAKTNDAIMFNYYLLYSLDNKIGIKDCGAVVAGGAGGWKINSIDCKDGE